ncbi:MAG: TonB-dependent receptor [Rhodocyclales bacterium]|nr:TonB-dependent receptor [Rhodocyclales bacterium]
MTLFAVLCLLGPDAGFAQDLSSLSLEELLSVKVTGVSRFDQRSNEAPSAVTIITRDQIRDHAWRSLGDMLDSVPGLFMTTDRVYGYLGVRGFLQPSDYNSNVLLLIDGIAANDAIYNQAFLGNAGLLDTALIERVEFIPGPGSSVYGSNAILGVINVITTTGRSERGTTAELSAGNHGSRGVSVRHGHADDRQDLLVSASAWRSDGETVTLADTDDARFGRARGLDHDRGKRFMARYAWDEFTLLGAYSERTKGYATAPYGTVFGDPRTVARDTQALIALTHRTEWQPGLNLQTRASFGSARYKAKWAFPLPDGTNRDDSDSRWWGVEVQATDTRFEHHTLVYGAEYRDEFRLRQHNADLGPEPDEVRLDDSRSARHLGVYAQDEWRIDNWRINAGLRIDHYSSFGSTVNPRLGIIHLISPRTTVKYLFGSAYRAPNVYEMHYHDGNDTMKANPDLDPERVRSLELALEHHFDSDWRAAGSLFRNQIRKLIVQRLDPEDGLLAYQNLGRTSVRGVTLSASRIWSDGTRLSFSSSWQATHDSESGQRLTHSPRHVAKADVSVPLGNWRATLEARYLGARTTPDSRVSAQSWANLALVSIDPVAAGARVSLRVNNLFDRDLADPASEEFAHDRLPREGRTAWVTLAWRL